MIDDHLAAMPNEIQMIGGLLKCVVFDDDNSYATRSALVARIVAYLKLIYLIDRI